MVTTTTPNLTHVAIACGAAAKADKSTATAVQLQRALELLRVRHRHTYEFRARGISHPAARIKDLVAKGFVITSSRITTVDADSFVHRNVALYELVSEPEGGAA